MAASISPWARPFNAAQRGRHQSRRSEMNYASLLPHFLDRYAIRVVQHEHLRTSENVVVRLLANDGTPYALRIRRMVGAYREQIESELIFLRDLRRGVGLDIPAPVATRTGELYSLLPDGADVYMGVLFTWVPGVHVGGADITPVQMGQMARAVAQLHMFSRTYMPPPGFLRPTYDSTWFLGATSWRASADFVKLLDPEAAACLHRASDTVGAFLQTFPQNAETFGLIHYDLHAGNFLFTKDAANLIDFDECGWGYYLFDLAHILFEFVDHPDFESFQRIAVEQYRAQAGPGSLRDDAMVPFLALQAVAYANWMYRLFWRDGRTDALGYWIPRIVQRIQKLGL